MTARLVCSQAAPGGGGSRRPTGRAPSDRPTNRVAWGALLQQLPALLPGLSGQQLAHLHRQAAAAFCSERRRTSISRCGGARACRPSSGCHPHAFANACLAADVRDVLHARVCGRAAVRSRAGLALQLQGLRQWHSSGGGGGGEQGRQRQQRGTQRPVAGHSWTVQTCKEGSRWWQCWGLRGCPALSEQLCLAVIVVLGCQLRLAGRQRLGWANTPMQHPMRLLKHFQCLSSAPQCLSRFLQHTHSLQRAAEGTQRERALPAAPMALPAIR